MSGSLSVKTFTNRKRSRGLKDPAYFDAHRRLRGPLIPATGPGSINAESEMRQLVEAGKAAEAAALWEAHHAIRNVGPMRWGKLWYEMYKLGDPRAKGVE